MNETIPKGNKFTPRSNTYYLVGFTNTGYTVFDPSTNKTFNVCNVTIDETKLYRTDFPNPNVDTFFLSDDFNNHPNNNFNSTISSNTRTVPFTNIPTTTQTDERFSKGDIVSETRTSDDVADANLTEESDSETEICEIEKDEDWNDNNARLNYCFSNPCSIFTDSVKPIMYREAISNENVAKRGPPIQAKLDAMTRHNVFEVIKRTKEMKVIPLKWVFTVKQDGSPKARIVAVGCRDKEQYTNSDTASPTPSASTIRWLFAIVIQYSWNIRQYDVKNAFLHAKMHRIKYVSLPKGMSNDSKGLVCKIKQGIIWDANSSKVLV